MGLSFCANVLIGFETFTTGNEWLDTLLGLLIRVNEYSYFPFISWIVIALLSPVLAIVSNIWVNILIAFFVLLLSYYGGKLLKKTILVRV